MMRFIKEWGLHVGVLVIVGLGMGASAHAEFILPESIDDLSFGGRLYRVECKQTKFISCASGGTCSVPQEMKVNTLVLDFRSKTLCFNECGTLIKINKVSAYRYREADPTMYISLANGTYVSLKIATTFKTAEYIYTNPKDSSQLLKLPQRSIHLGYCQIQ